MKKMPGECIGDAANCAACSLYKRCPGAREFERSGKDLHPGDVVVIHTDNGLEDRSGWVGHVLYAESDMAVGRYLIQIAPETVQGYCASYLADDLEVIDHIPLESTITRKVRVYNNAIEVVEQTEGDNQVSGWTELYRSKKVLRNLVTLMLLYRDREIAESLRGKVNEAEWVLQNLLYTIELRFGTSL